ncbi:MAG: hypothetical protein HYS27_28750 [Deltaproteobacteria bacterium]|nr:hypothetical protein [Deltaproteobacteria bacterium]
MRALLAAPAGVVALVALAGCVPPWRQAYVRAEDALATGRYADAATAFTESCDQDATASDACSRAKTMRRQVVEETVLTAKRACTDDLRACLSSIADARRLVVREPELRRQVEALLDEASAAHVGRCRALPAKTYHDAMLRARCLALAEDEVGTEAHHARVREALAELASTLDPGDGEAAVDRLVRAGLAQCYAPSAARAGAVERARQAVVQRHRHDIALDVDGIRGDVAVALCNALAARAPVRCVERAGATTIRVAGSFDLGRVEHSARRVPKSVRYVDWVEEQPNPQHVELRRAVDKLAGEVRATQRAADEAKNACDAADEAVRRADYCYDCDERSRRDEVCAYKDTAERALREVKSAHDDKERQLRFTDAVLRIDHTAVYDYVELHHVWELPSQVQAACAVARFTDPPLSAQRVVRVEDVEHTGFPRAGLVQDPLVEPSGAELAERAQRIAHDELLAFTSRCLTSLSKDTSRCDGPLDCWVREALYAGRDPLTSVVDGFSQTLSNQRPDLPPIACRQP